MLKLLFPIWIFCSCLTALAQSSLYTWEDFVQDYMENEYSEETSDEELTISLLEELQEIHNNPIPINQANSKDLLVLPFISQRQADSIVSYIKKYGPMYSVKELMLVPYLDYSTRNKLSLFIYCDEAPDKSVTGKNKWKQQISGYHQIPLYERKGYQTNTYQGIPLSATLRYRGQWNDKIEWGATLQNDEGEPFFQYRNYPFDYQSYYLVGKNKGKGLVRQWILGDYQLHFGMGLIAGHGFWQNPVGLLSFSRNQLQTISKHTSTDECHFFRGGAVTLQYKHTSMTVFGSHRLLDATVKNGKATTLLTSGLHRTLSEIHRKENVRSIAGGTHIQWTGNHWQWGASALFTQYSKPLEPGSALYRRYYMKGRNFFNCGIHYQYRNSRFTAHGECATDHTGGWGIINQITCQLTQQLQTFFLYRYYDKRYKAPYAFAFAEGGHVQNEHGAYIGYNWTIHRQWNLKGYFDYSSHPHAIYRADFASQRMKIFQLVTFQPQKDLSFDFRYQFSQKEENNKSKTALVDIYKNSGRLQAHYLLGSTKHTTGCYFIYLLPVSGPGKWGKMIAHRISATKGSISGYLSGAWFNTSDYSTAMHCYENGPSYSFSFPTCYGHGWRASAMIRKKWNRLWDITIKYGITRFTNQKTISSSHQLINHPYKQDLSLQWMMNL